MSNFKIISADEVIDMLKGRYYRWAQVHHTYKPNHGDFTGDNHMSLQQGMYNYHVFTRGWQDIGQHLTLFPDGKFVTGRDFDIMPAGIKGYNSGAFMIEHVGDFDKGQDKLEGEQLKSSLKVYNYLINECRSEILFHREKAVKSCPGTGVSKSKFVSAVKNFDGNTETVDVEEKTGSHTAEKDSKWTKVTGNWTGQTLGRGEYGKPVRQLQNKLASNDPPFYPNKGAKNNGVDSYYGKNTEDAVTRYQSYYGLAVDELAGSEVFRSLTGSKTSGSSSDSKTIGGGSAIVPYPGHLIRRGSRGKDVKRIQRAVGVKVDGIFGSGTERAVKAYQRRHSLSVDGLVGKNTWNTMF